MFIFRFCDEFSVDLDNIFDNSKKVIQKLWQQWSLPDGDITSKHINVTNVDLHSN